MVSVITTKIKHFVRVVIGGSVKNIMKQTNDFGG